MEVNEKILQWNNTDLDVDFSNNMGTMLHNSAVRFAECTATVDFNGSITYEQLDKYSNAVCNMLLENKNKINYGYVCILTDEVKERLCYLSGILKAGMAYVPLDKKAPVSRNRMILENIKGSIILTDENNYDTARQIADTDSTLICSYNIQELGQMNCEYTPVKHSIKDPAYIIHTSGSTGRPKGVKVSQRAMINICAATREIFDISSSDRTCMLQNVSFDYSILDMFPFMLGGAALYFVPEDIKADVNRLNQFMIDNGITLQPITTALYNMLCEFDNPVLKKVFVAGEKMIKYLPKSYEIYNFYGPTESTVYITYYKVEKQEENIPIGRPVANSKIFIIKSDGTVADIGQKGEICITGANLADGYINNTEETRKRFVPFVLDPDEIMYRTGDVGEWREDGQIVCYGRIDFQIKHRGYRIELDEINYHILQSGLVTESIVLYNDRAENKYIVCFYCTADNKDIDSKVLSGICADLPEYMIPAKFVRADKLPLNNHDKVDRSALLDSLAARKNNDLSSCSDEEAVLRNIWSELLDINSDFDENQSFRNLGGHSILSMIMLRKLKAELGVNISFAEHISAETLRGHLDLIDSKKHSIRSTLKNIWCEMLDLDEEFDDSDSFNSLGGHSILSMLMLKRVSSELGINISLTEFLKTDSFSKFVKLAEDKENKNTAIADDYKDCYENRYEPFGLNEMQQAYYIGRFDGIKLGSIPTHLYLELECREFDMDKFVRVINRLFRHHDALRIRVDSNSTQHILEYYEITAQNIPVIDLRNNDDAGKRFLQCRDGLNNIKIDMSKDSLVHIRVILRDDCPATVQLYLDGLVADGWGQEILIRDFDMLYSDENAELIQSPHLFRDYVLYTADHENNQDYEKAKSYWTDKIKALPDAPELPLLRSPESVLKPTVRHVNESVSEDIWHKFENTCSKKGLTTSNVMLTVLGKVLARWSRKKDFVINLPVSNRFFDKINYENTFGVFSDFLLFDIHDERSESLSAAAQKNQKKFYELTANRAFSGMDVIHELTKVKRNIGNAAPVVFTSLIDIPEYTANYVSKKYFQTHTSQIWFDVIVLKCNGEVQFSCDYVADILDKTTISAIMATFAGVIRSLSVDEDSWNKCNIDIITDIPVSIDSAAGRKTQRVYKPIVSFLEESAVKFAENTAVRTSERSYKYCELFNDVRKTAAVFKSYGIKKDTTAAILMNKRYEQIVSVLAVLYCGAVYLPMDTQNSDERICYCLKESDACAVISESAMIEKYKQMNSVCTVLNVDSCSWNESDESYIDPELSENDLYCIIYTSGSTGTPKGVMLEQRGLLNCLEFTNELIDISENDSIISLTNLCHDMSIYDIFGMLLAGASIVLPDADKVKEPVHWIDLVEKHHVTLWNSVPAITEMALETLEYTGRGNVSSLRAIIMGGDVLQVNMPSRLRKYSPFIDIYNVGGPTEATIWSVYHKVEKEDESLVRIPLGKAIDNVNYMILNDNLQLCPYDTAGTIYTEGINLSKGYLKSPDRTKEKFVINPYTGNLMYNTGDIGKYRKNGDIDIIGRSDFQVKINGKRIELGEVEAAVVRNTKIDTAAAVYDKEDKNIYLYYKVNSPITVDEIKSELENILPDFMLPSVYMEIEQMPLSLNGKIDRDSLPGIIKTSQSISDEILNDTEREILDVYKKVIDNENVSVNDNFFNAGGDSIKAIRLLYCLTEKFDVSLQLTDIFKYTCVRGLAEYISNNNLCSDKITHTPVSDKMELSVAQKGMWFQVRSADIQNSSHVFMLASSAVILTEDFDLRRFTTAVNLLIKENPELTTEIYEVDHAPYLRYSDVGEYIPQHTIIEKSSKEVKEILEQKAMNEKYNLSEYPLFSISSADADDGNTVITVGIHHIIADAYSVSKIFSRLGYFYSMLAADASVQVHKRDLNYNDFTQWQYKKLEENYYDNDIAYWRKKLSDVPVNKFSDTDKKWGDFQGALMPINISKRSLTELRNICADNSCSVFAGLVSVVNIMIHYYFCSDRAAVGIAYSGRSNAQISDIIGSFAVPSLVITKMKDDMTFDELLKLTDKEMKDAIEHANLPMNVIVSKCGADMRYSSLPYNILVNCLDTQTDDENTLFKDFRYSNIVVPADLILTAELSKSSNSLYMLYRKNIFQSEDITEWCSTITDIIQIILSDRNVLLCMINEKLDNE